MRLVVPPEPFSEADGFATVCANLSEGELQRDVTVSLSTFNQSANGKSHIEISLK